jgi:hypothetical protein
MSSPTFVILEQASTSALSIAKLKAEDANFALPRYEIIANGSHTGIRTLATALATAEGATE